MGHMHLGHSYELFGSMETVTEHLQSHGTLREPCVNSIKSLTQGRTIKRQTVLEHGTDWIRKTLHIQYRSKSLKRDVLAGKDQGTFLGHTWLGISPIPQRERITVSTVCVCVCTLHWVHGSGYVFLNESSCHPVGRTLLLLKNLKMLYNLWLGNILYRGPSLGKSLWCGAQISAQRFSK